MALQTFDSSNKNGTISLTVRQHRSVWSNGRRHVDLPPFLLLRRLPGQSDAGAEELRRSVGGEATLAGQSAQAGLVGVGGQDVGAGLETIRLNAAAGM